MVSSLYVPARPESFQTGSRLGWVEAGFPGIRSPARLAAHYNSVVGAPSLESLFRRYADSRDEGAARELVARTRPRLLAIARRIGDPSDAEDSVQTAYLSLLHKREGEFGAPVLAWLVTATVRIAYRAKASRQRMTEVVCRLDRPPGPDTPAAHAGAADEERLLRDRVADLPGSLRDPLVLHYFQGLSAEEAGRLLGLSRDAVKKRLQRARAVLRSSWGPRLGSLLLVLPWWCADTATAVAGGVVMKKAVVIATLLFALAATTVGTVWRSRTRAGGEPRSVVNRQVPETSTADAAEPGTVETEVAAACSGVVVTPDGKPVEGATVRIGAYHWKTGGRLAMVVPTIQALTRTDRKGRFTLDPQFKDNIAAVEYHALAEGFAWTAVRCPLDEQARIVLRKGGTLLVSARHADGTPVPGAVHVLRRRAERGFEDFLSASGAEARFDLVPGAYRVRVSATDLAPSRRIDVEITADSARELTVTLASGVAYRIQVVDPEGLAVENAEVQANGPGGSGGVAKTDRSGRCRIGGIAIPHTVGGEGSYRGVSFWVKAAGYAPYRHSVRAPDTEGEEEIRLELRRGARVAFRFRGPDGKPLTKQQVYFFPQPSESPIGHQLWRTTDENGEVAFPALEKGSVLVQVMEIEKHPRTIKLSGKPQDVVIDLRPGDHEVAGRVLGPDGSPVESGSVGFVPAAQHKTGPGIATRVPIADDGSFRVTGLEAGAGDLWVWAHGFEAQRVPARAPSDAVEMRLREGHSVAGVVATREGDPVAGVSVRLERRFGGWTETGTVKSDAKGRFSFRGVGDDARLHVRVRRDGQWIESHGLGYPITPGDTSVRLTVKPKAEGWGLKIPIEVVDRGGRALPGRMEITYWRDGKRGRWHLSPHGTGTPGRFVLPYYDAPGTCDFRFSMTGYLPVKLSGVVIADKAELPALRVVFDRGATLAVVARYADGSPVASASLRCDGSAVRTDANGRAEFGGFQPGARRVEIYKKGDYFLHAGGVEVELPGRVEVVLARRGVVVCSTRGTGPFGWKLVDADGVVRDETTTEEGWVRLFTTVAGAHGLGVAHAAGPREPAVDVRLGDSVSVGGK